VEGEGGTEAGTEELAGWTLQTQAPVQAGTVLVSIPNVLTLSPTRRKFKLPTGAAAMQVGGNQGEREGRREGGEARGVFLDGA
jgi:hypothetical protein